MFKYLYKNKKSSYKFLTFSVILFMFFSSFLEIGKAYLFKILFDRASSVNNYSIKLLIAISFLFIFITFLLKNIMIYLNSKLEYKIRNGLRNDLLKAIQRIEASKSLKPTNGISLFNNDLKILFSNYFITILILISKIISFLFGIYFILKLNLFFLIPIILGGGFISLLTHLTKNLVSNKQKDSVEKMEKVIYRIKGYFNNSYLIKNYNLFHRVNYDFSNSNLKHSTSVFELQKIKGYINNLGDFIILGMFISIKIIAVYMAIIGEITVGDIIFIVQTSNSVAGPLFAFTSIVTTINSTTGIRKNIFSILQTKINKKSIQDINEINIKNLSYSYNESSVFENITFKFKKGKKYLLVGKSGSGKSTLLKLLTKQIENYKGSILIDNSDLKNISDESYFKYVKIVNQKPQYIASSIKNNIIGDSKYIEKKYKELINSLNLKGFISSLSEKDNTILDEDFINISGGQLQRISLARALYSNSTFLILDEPFSALDKENMMKIEALLLKKQCTLIMISHKSDENLLLKYDKIIDFGTKEF